MSNSIISLSSLWDNTWIKIGIALILLAGAILLLVATRRNGIKTNATRRIVYGAMCVSIACVLNLFKVNTAVLAGGISGSVTLLRTLPLILYACTFGAPSGVIACVAYGLVDMLFGLDASGGIVQVLLDYIVAFGLIGLSGLARNTKQPYLLGTIIATAGRFCASYVSGAVFFGQYAPEGMNIWVYSLIYQSITVLPDMLLVFIVFAFIQRTNVFKQLPLTMLGQQE
ncbi:MAG: energy-coupled thiamine transporter ThiT [Clostridia bacterium]|nr:energy-coupled thiamine transporter ThiT [Clostridia bacterium]